MKKPIPFGKYLLLERINVGGMAEVFKGKAFGVEGFERLVAVKRILPSIAEDTEFITMFIDEAKIAVQLTHANIAQIFDLGKVGDSFFIAMEYVHGKDLRAIFDRARKRGEPLPVPMACYVVMKVCEGLDYAHNKKDPAGRDLNLVHRDVSPQNLLISYDGEVKIIDFGIAKAAGKAGKTQAGILKGKFGYMSPEQVRGLPLDRRSDIFAMGICLYELLTGERLFVGESDFSTLEKVRNVEIMPPSTYNRRIPEELEQIVLKALAKDVDDRYQTAMDLHDDLQSFMYTSGNFFARKDLSGYMRKSFAEEIAKESARDEEYRKAEMAATGPSGLDAFDDLPAADRGARPSSPGRHPTPPPASLSSNPASAKRQMKRTMLGMGGGTPPPPPPPRRSTPGPPPAPPPRASAPPAETLSPTLTSGPALDMDWDDEELSTQIYDKPEGGMGDSPYSGGPFGPPVAGPPAASPMPPSSVASSPSRPPQPRTSSAGLGLAPGPMPGPGGPAQGYGPGFPGPSPAAPGGGAPSPFDDYLAARGREPTALTRAEKKGSGALIALLLAGALIVLAVAGVGGWFFFWPKEPGVIQFTTMPADPVVVFDERPVPALQSPFLIANVVPGEVHLLEVSKSGYRTWSMQVEVQPGQTLVLPAVTLERTSGGAQVAEGTGFTLDTEPSGANVFVDDRRLDQRTPVTVTDLNTGTHTIRVEHGSRYAPWQTQIQAVADQVIAIPTAVLSLRSVTVRFRSDPSGAEVVLVRGRERRNVGSTPTSADVDLSGDSWIVEMAADGYETYRAPLDVPAGREELEVSAELERRAIAAVTPRVPPGVRMVTPPTTPQTDMGGSEPPNTQMGTAGGFGTLRVQTRPWSQVYVDGRLVGNTPQMNIRVPAGSHRLTLVNPEFNIRETVSVNVGVGETVTKILTLNPG